MKQLKFRYQQRPYDTVILSGNLTQKMEIGGNELRNSETLIQIDPEKSHLP